ncbi:MAG: hypothetical protein NVSMB25_22210 [Thermoleophilaceae bacterium]
MNPTTVLIAEDDAPMRLALGAVVDAEPALELVGAAEDAEQAIVLARELRPQVCILDVTMPGGGGVRATREIRALAPWTRIVAFSGHQDRTTVLEMIRAGASGYLVKGASGAEIVAALERAARGESSLSPEVTNDVVGELAERLARQDEEAESRRAVAAGVRRVLDERLVKMAFQPIMDLQTGERLAFEALARVAVEPYRGPHLWFAEAREAGLLQELELAAVDAALRDIERLAPASFLAINLSPETAAAQDFARALVGADCRRLVIEITEHAPIQDYDALSDALAPLRARGIRLAIDDAGAGFASLRHILALAPDIIKIDMTLTRDLQRDRAKRALTSALISFASETEAIIVAEGIENQEEITALRKLGVRFGQGYHLGRPAPLELASDRRAGNAA